MKPMLMEWVLTSALLILAVVALRALLGRRISAGLRYALWAVALMDMLREIKAGIRAQTSTTELATKQITEAMMHSIAKGEKSVPSVPGASPEQLAGVYSALTGATPELGQHFSGLIQNFITGFIDIAEQQGLTNGDANGTDQ